MLGLKSRKTLVCLVLNVGNRRYVEIEAQETIGEPGFKRKKPLVCSISNVRNCLYAGFEA